MRYSRIYKIWLWLNQRCSNIKNPWYKNYWWRGINVLRKCFEEFYGDMWNTYKDWLSIERLDVNWDYCKENCTWIPISEQQYNKTDTRYVIYKWEHISLWKLCKQMWLNYFFIRNRINSWMPIELAIEKTKRIKHRDVVYKWKEYKINDLIREKWLNINTINARLRYWYTIEEAIDLWCQKEKSLIYNNKQYNSLKQLAIYLWISIRTLSRKIKSWKIYIKFIN